MYGEHGHKLVQHARRTQTLPHLPPYQPELVREVTRETRQLHKDTEDILAPFEGSFAPAADPPAAVNLLVDHLAMRRNKRCLLAYHKTRTDRLEEMIWRGEDVLESINSAAAGSGTSGDANGASAVSAEDGSKTSLSPEEEEYVRRFEDLLGVLKGQWTDIDLSGSMEPPKDLFVDVRVLKDAGEIQTEYGSIMLTKNSQFYVRSFTAYARSAQDILQSTFEQSRKGKRIQHVLQTHCAALISITGAMILDKAMQWTLVPEDRTSELFVKDFYAGLYPCCASGVKLAQRLLGPLRAKELVICSFEVII